MVQAPCHCHAWSETGSKGFRGSVMRFQPMGAKAMFHRAASCAMGAPGAPGGTLVWLPLLHLCNEWLREAQHEAPPWCMGCCDTRSTARQLATVEKEDAMLALKCGSYMRHPQRTKVEVLDERAMRARWVEVRMEEWRANNPGAHPEAEAFEQNHYEAKRTTPSRTAPRFTGCLSAPTRTPPMTSTSR